MTEQGSPQTDMDTIRFKWEWSINTLAIGATFMVGVAGWGYMLAEVRGTLENHKESIAEIRADVKRIDDAHRRLETIEMRIVNVERLAGSASDAARSLEKSINTLTSDLRVATEVLQRLERQRRGRRTPFDDAGN